MVNAPLEDKQSTSIIFVLLISAAAALGGFLFGFDTAVINGAVVALGEHFNVGPVLVGMSVSLALMGSAVGALSSGFISDRYGRVKPMLLAAVMFTASGIGSGFPFTVWDFIFWRFVGGMGIGLASAITPAYIAEISPANLRGRFGSLQQLAIVTGIFIAMLSNYILVKIAGGSASMDLWLGAETWRWMFWAEVPPALLYGFAALMIPESPRYLIGTGREREAESVLSRVLGEHVLEKIEEIKLTLRVENGSSFADLKGRFGFTPIIWVGLGLSVLQQFVGINVIFYYGSMLWRSVGFSEENSLWITVITGVVNIVTTLVAIAFIDRVGRKPLLLLGSAGMLLTLGLLAFLFANAPLDAAGHPALSGSSATTALVAANLYVFCFGFSWGPVVWVLLGEMFNNRVRASALALGAGAQWVANFMVSASFPSLVEWAGLGKTYSIYAFFAAVSFLFVMFFVRETRGKELEEME
ncbi:MFS transporter, sugar porter (SP) family [Maridesulfovibrio ferrireducens]|uniref:MFS transporter, sugar porter (SP) family n=1 Tax=Maridesulfovibrio ferrireducens TaxID=246191 RepID=A0A1G9J933_9BACT|nr:sugar porter family MFS transporter [Maridesulfovibrio ferrireducens]SDL33654.1 MFS transporter, sugar porter (SP) family [Maridesulfovibrio ferrireducens]